MLIFHFLIDAIFSCFQIMLHYRYQCPHIVVVTKIYDSFYMKKMALPPLLTSVFKTMCSILQLFYHPILTHRVLNDQLSLSLRQIWFLCHHHVLYSRTVLTLVHSTICVICIGITVQKIKFLQCNRVQYLLIFITLQCLKTKAVTSVMMFLKQLNVLKFIFLFYKCWFQQKDLDPDSATTKKII